MRPYSPPAPVFVGRDLSPPPFRFSSLCHFTIAARGVPCEAKNPFAKIAFLSEVRIVLILK